MTGGKRFSLGLALVMAILGVAIVVMSDNDAVGIVLIVFGVLLLALQAGRGRPKGGQEDH